MHHQIRDVMTPNPVTLRSNATIEEAAMVMRDDGIGDVLVVEDGSLYGIVTDRDIVVRAIARHLPLTTKLREIASRNPVSVSPDDGVEQAIELMRQHAIRRMPVVEDGCPVGIVSLGDLAEERDPQSLLGHISEAPPNN